MSSRETDLEEVDEPAPVPTAKPKPEIIPAFDDDEESDEAPPKAVPAAPSAKGLNAAETDDTKPGLIDSCTGDNKATTEVGTVCGDAARENLGMILGISGGVIALLLLIAFYFWRKRRNANRKLEMSRIAGKPV